MTITVHGAFPTARYFSLATYNAAANDGKADSIDDDDIAPNADGSFTVTVSHSSEPIPCNLPTW